MKRVVSFAVAIALVLGACTHARVVQREPGAHRPAKPAPPRPAIAPLPRDGVHVVQRGETLYGISFRYGLRFQDVAAWNGIGDPYLIDIGQRLRVTPRGGAVAGTPSRPSAPRPAPRPAPTQPTTTAPTQAATTPARPAATAPAPSVAAPRPVTTAPVTAIGPMAWQWPTNGDLVGRFVSGDQTQQGIDIAGRSGQDVRAAADGVVVYSGAGLVGYGELIIVKHSEEWLSAYGHNQTRLVGEGARVSAGQVIARMGRTGAARDMLHFEIRRNGKPIDPLGQLPRR